MMLYFHVFNRLQTFQLSFVQTVCTKFCVNLFQAHQLVVWMRKHLSERLKMYQKYRYVNPTINAVYIL